MATRVGKIIDMYRFPVKSFAGERLESCQIEPYGLYGDRFCAFYDETKQGWNSFFTARQIPNMLAYQAKHVDDGIVVTGPDGRTFGWDKELMQEIQSYSKRKVSMKSYREPNPTDPNLMSVDAASILIVTDATLRKLEALWGKPVDHRRFRANIVIAVEEGIVSETEWLGKRLSVGDIELQVDEECSRCMITTLDPDTQERDPSLLKILNTEMKMNFGVYASVKKVGQIRVGDNVYFT
ncbi:MOSC domain-containing protein [Paenibacillus sp. SC116]|uniref:MOSC domain-containing protein n=1 Tax=Paenibacillus sp. SC116 TaxID=2968986 RepID=UPI00215B09E0|nr:MOSC N-terminal beta barrel domain-containing protein [Paenibacillus sp. SC116]MCR8844276.1 MOSC domain-containing protein [Paenibacillus sp. SC116]